MTKAMVIFHGQLNTYRVLVLDNGGFEQVDHVLNKVMQDQQGSAYDRRASEICTNFLRTHGNSVVTSSVNPNDLDYVYSYNVYRDLLTVESTREKKIIYHNAPRLDFKLWIKNNTGNKLDSYLDKTIKFTYKGGSGTCARLVKVTSVNKDTLKGWDVNKSTANKPAYRSYKLGNIVGKVEVIS